jgi:predicted anti-sigma-YlaC factor YlaD
MSRRILTRGAPAGALALLLLAATGCSVRQYTVNQLGDALARSSGATFASDDDPDLIKAAAPFSLKLTESLLAESPDNVALLQTAASGFTQYAYAFVQEDGDELMATDVAAAQALHGRARRLYLRARDYGLRGLEVRHPGFGAALAADPARAAALADKADVPLLYWTAASWGAAIALAKDDPALIGDLPQVQALIDRAVALDEAWDQGALHTFLISYEMARPGAPDAAARSQREFERAVAESGGRLAAPYVAYAEAVPVQRQQAAEFRRVLGLALAVNPDADPPDRLANLVAQRRARWLLGRVDDLFLTP